MRLQGAFDNEVHVAVQKFLSNGVPAEVNDLYTALQRSNSSLKRKQKKVIIASIERVLDFIGVENSLPADDPEASLEANIPEDDSVAQLMNKSLRSNLAPPPTPTMNGDDAGLKKRKANGESLPKRQKRENERPSTAPPTGLGLADVAGLDNAVRQFKKLLVAPMTLSHRYRDLSAPLTKGILLQGPPGCGKTMLTRAYAAEGGWPFIEILGPSIVSGMSGESEKGIRERFDEAKKNAPCVIFIDEIDAIAPKRDSSQSQMEKRIVAQLLVSMDELSTVDAPIIVVAATNRPDSLDPALRRGGRFGTEINIGVPNEQMRQSILEAQTRKMPVSSDVDFKKLAKMTAGYVGADLHDLVGKAVTHRMDEYIEAVEQQAVDLNLVAEAHEGPQVSPAVLGALRLIARGKEQGVPEPEGFEDMSLTMDNFLAVLPEITPSSKREGFTTIPDVSWKDIGALENVREELQNAIVDPIENPEVYEAHGIAAASGVLLWGPPGCGKTLLAKAVAAESKANFISVKGPELLNKYVGESEASVRKVFQRARAGAPCVIFFDEFDALVPKRDGTSSEASARVVNTLLTELDGMNARAGIYVIAATNRPEMIDEAMLRPGRLGLPLFVDLPGAPERVDIMRALTRTKRWTFTDEMATIVHSKDCEGYSGADLGELLKQAIMAAIRQKVSVVTAEHFAAAVKRIGKGSVKDMAQYYALNERFGRP
ncbi:hypothetical protein M409DRAFT_49790 [Zasmidium cellare ATCC 36951]|uniref:Peroxisomal ATPase PEX1 n=1 Tax=Zasmidium cellare ATCC 36951 TaxID=1080233 RepID=A0A6A6D4M6_ZASCE|nr:uncharacterized protein M409DRAFT_49790 [Zasmidium cellare ATCC 36951]KAF2173330.1 hypothetical protein M409DRAFT_49790 [Zasmidium cellare ATCC 36951]